MKELQNIIHRHFEDPKQKKRYLAVLIALSMLVSFMVPLILMEPADSITKNKFRASSAPVINRPENLGEEISGTMLNNYAGKDANEVNGYTYSPDQMDLFTLLFGATVNENGELVPQDWYAGKNNLDDALDAEKAEYFLGYASDFCAFIEGDFTATEADAEGRVAVGGNLSFEPKRDIWNYQIGSGDYVTMKPLGQIANYDEYDNIYGFASALVGGKMFRINTLSTGYGHTRTSKDSLSQEEIQADINAGYHAVNKDNKYAYSVYYKPEDGLYKYFIVGNVEDSTHYLKTTGEDVPYHENNNEQADCTHDFPADCVYCNPDSEQYNPDAHSYLGTVNELAQMYQMPEGYSVRQLIQDTFTYVRTRSEVLSQIGSIHVTPNGSSVIFDATGKIAPDAKTVYFSVDNWSGGYDYIEFKGIPNGANVVVNCNNSGVVYAVGKENNGKVDVKTVLNGETISNKDGPGNNNPESSRILYNFPNASEIHINGNFNGTILAPNADAKSKEDECTGHLSGALIAKSFKGGLEFGYRPYRGGNDILGMASGYEVPVEKLISGTTKNLAGAMFAIKEGDNVISLFESINGVNHVAIPSDVDFTGNTVYMPESIETGSATKDTTSNVSVNTNLVKPLIVTAYDLNNNAVALDSNFNVGDTIVLHANQPVEWGAYGSQEIDATSNNENNTLTIKIKKPLTTDGSVGQYSFSPKISGVNSSQITISVNVNSVVFNVPESFTIGDEVELSVSNLSSDVSVEYFINNERVGTGQSTTFTPVFTGNQNITAKITAHGTTTDITKTITGNVPDMALTVDPKSFTVGENIELNVTGVPDGATVKFSIFEQYGYKTIQEGQSTSCTLVQPTQTGEVRVKAEVYLKENNNDKKVWENETTITGTLPDMSLEATKSYTVGTDDVTMSVTGAPTGATIKFYYNEGLVHSGSETSYTYEKPRLIGESIPVKAEVSLNGTNLWSNTVYVTGKMPDIKFTATPDPYIIGKDDVTMKLSGAPEGATVKFYFNDIYNNTVHVETAKSGTDVTYTFKPMQEGAVKIKATVDLDNNNNPEWTTGDQLTITGKMPEITFTATPDPYIVGTEDVTLEVTGAPEGAKIKFYFGDMGNPKQEGYSTEYVAQKPTNIGDVNVKATVDLNNDNNPEWSEQLTIKGEFAEMSISVSEPWEINKNLTLGVTGAPNGSDIKYTIQGPNGYKHETNQYNQYFTTQNAGEYTITATVSMNNVSKELTKVINVIDPSATASNLTETVSFSLRRGRNVFSVESEQESIEITASGGKTIKSIKLNTDLINNNTNYSLDVKFYDANNVQKGDKVTVNNSNVNNAINCPDGETITKIVVEAASGAVKVKSYDVTYTEPCKSVTRTAPFNLQTNSENSYVIDTDVFRDLVASDSSDNKLTDYDSITFTLSSNADPYTGVKYWLYKGEDQVEYSDTETFESGSFTIDDLSSRGITKIVIRAKDDTALPIVSYSIVSLTDTDTVPESVDNKKVITHAYVIEEIEAPHGFFPTTDKYEVNVVETVDLENISVVNGKYYPKDVHSVITVKKIGEENNLYQTDLHIKYGVNEDSSIDTNTRIIEVMNGDEVVDTFTIVKSSDALTGVNQIESVSHNNTPLDIDFTKADLIEGGKYYFNPDTMMIVPMPSEKIKFENTPGLLFKKVDDRGYAVKDVEITLTPSTNENGESLWSWVEGTTSEQLINVSKLDNVIYKISERNDPNDIYITAPDIFFKYEGGKIYYGASESELTNELDLINNREIRMVDMRIVGVELEINKVDESGKPLKGAEFDLYADAGEGVLLKSDIAVDNNGKATVNLADVDNSTYVENGYLKPGNYYLIETVIPEHLTDSSNKWYEDPGKIKFRVKDDFTVEYINEQTGGSTEEPTGKQYIESIDSFELDSKSAWAGLNWYWFKINNQYGMEEPYDKNTPNKAGVPEKGFADIKSIVVQFGGNTYIEQLYYDSDKSNGESDGNQVGKFNNSTKKFEVTFDTARDIYQFKVAGKDVTVESVQFIASDDTVYSYPATSAASLEDETAVVDETGEGTENESGESTETESGESTEGETGENTGEETPAVERELLEVDNTNSVKVLTVTNKEDDNERDVNVEKRWADDTGFKDLRPDVTFTLYQSITEITDRSQLTSEMIYKITDGEGNEVPYTITITGPDANGKWTGKFTGLPTKYLSNGEYVDYHYYIVETPVEGYSPIVEYTKDADGTLVAENRLDPVSVKATKKWSDPNGTKPESITVQLQVKVGDTWTNVEGKTLTLTAADNWTGNFTGLVKGKEYRLTESYVNGWEVESNPGSVVNGDPTENLTITNKPKEVEKGSLSISKKWQNAQGGELTTPNVSEVYVKLYRKVNKLWPVGQPLTSVYNEDGELVTVGVVDDYARLLQYSLYFYDGLMCGSGVDENSAYTWRTDCHKNDEVPGGFHDAGDHAMFGLPAGFTGSNLGWSLYEFRDEYDELGQTAHTKVITDYYADFFSRCIRNNNGTKELLVQKGHGNTDHAYWGIPELQDSRMDPVTMEGRNGKTGWTDGKKTIENEMYWRSDTGADIAAEYAASLALSCLNFYETDPDTYKRYLEKAKELFEYAVGKPALNEWGVNKDEWDPKTYMGFYESHEADDDMSWAAAWIALASKKVADAENNQSYRDDYNSYAATAKTYYDLIDWDWWDLGGYNWNNVKYGAAIANAAYLSDINGCNWDRVNNFVNNSCTGSDYKYINDWGQSRYNAGYQTIALVAAKHQKEGKNVGINATTAAAWAKGQMNYILNNASGYCYVTNFTENSTKRPHYRAGSGTRFEMAEKDDKTVIDGYDKDVNRLIGGMVGGSNGEGICHTDDRGNYPYEDVRSDYCANEVASDYNANLVGAAAGLYYFYRTGELYKIPGVKVQYLPDEEPETQAEETPAPQAEETPAPQAEEQQQSDDNSSNTVDTQTESSNTTASETVSSEQNSAETNTETGENSAQVAKLSSRFSNAFSILSVGFSRLATEGNSANLAYHTIVYDETFTNGTPVTKTFDTPYENIVRIEVIADSTNLQTSFNDWTYQPSQNGEHICTVDPAGTIKTFHFRGVYDKASISKITIRLYYVRTGISITNTDTNITEGDTLNLTYSGAAEGKTVTWSLPEGTSAAEIINGNVLKANIVDSDTDVEVTVSDTETTDTKTFTVKPLAFVDTKTTMNLKENSPQTLKLNSTRNLLENFKFESSNNSIVKVENGIATAVGEGTATITATDINNPAISATVNIEVKDVKPLTLGISANDIVINGTATLEPSEEAVTYKNYDTNIIQINGNTITAKKNGSTKITAETSDGRTAEVTINVLEMSINVEKKSIEVTEEVILTINNPPHNATFEWHSNASQIVSVNNGTIKGVSVGSTQVYVIAKVNGNEVARATTENITVNYGRIMGEVNVSNQYKPVHTQNGESKSFDSYDVFTKDNTPNLLKNQTIDYIAVQFSYNNNTVDKKNVSGVFMYSLATSDGYINVNFSLNEQQDCTQLQNGVLYIPIDPGVEIDAVKFNKWNNDREAKVENIYFYSKKQTPSISGVPTESDPFIVGDEPITLTANHFDGNVTWSIVSGSEYAEIDPNTGVLTAKGAGTVTVKAVYGDQEATADVTIGAYQLKYESGETDTKNFKVHVGPTPNDVMIDLPSDTEFTINDNDIAQIGSDNKITGLKTGSVGFTAEYNGDSINGTIEVIDPLAITAEGGDNENKKILIYSNKPQQFTASNFVGTVQWTVSGDGIATISENGLLKPTSAGNVTVTATDADGTTATYDVTIQLGSALVDITGMEPVGEIITISSENEWKATVADLPVVDANGDYYSYYIVECNEKGEISNSNPIRGTDGSMYIPISYENGEMLNTGSSTELSVSNRYSGKTQGQMPSSGGVGRTTYYFFGGMIMLLSAAGYTCTRRRQSSRRAK